MAIGPYYVGDRPVESLVIDVTRGGTSITLGNFSGATATLTGPTGVSQELDAFVEDDNVVVGWPEGVTAFTEAGPHVLTVRLTGPENSATLSPIGFNVLSTVPAAWATVGDVAAYTGKEVAQELLTQAQAQVEIAARVYSSRTYLYGQTPVIGQTIGLTAQDSQLLRMAVAYQAAWLAAQPGIYDRSEVTSIGQDGVSANYTGTGLTLSPHAKNAIKRLSWSGSRSVSIGNARAQQNLVDLVDDALPWRTL